MSKCSFSAPFLMHGISLVSPSICPSLARTEPELIRNLTVTEITTSSASLSWTEPAGNSFFYRVEWADGARTQSTELFETSLRITHLTAGVQYTYRVIAVAGDNNTEGKPDEMSVYTSKMIHTISQTSSQCTVYLNTLLTF